MKTLNFSTSDFSYNKESKTFVEEISTLSCTYEELKKGFPITFTLQSTRTHATRTFKMIGYERSAEGEIYGVKYESQYGEFKAIIFND